MWYIFFLNRTKRSLFLGIKHKCLGSTCVLSSIWIAVAVKIGRTNRQATVQWSRQHALIVSEWSSTPAYTVKCLAYWKQWETGPLLHSPSDIKSVMQSKTCRLRKYSFNGNIYDACGTPETCSLKLSIRSPCSSPTEKMGFTNAIIIWNPCEYKMHN